MTAFQVNVDHCRVKARKGNPNQMPVGFRQGLPYRVVAGLMPNGSTDLHYLVINEAGQTVPLRHDLVDILKDDAVGGDNQAGHVVELPFPDATRQWCARTPDNRDEVPYDVIAYDLEGRRIVPHAIKRDTETRALTVFWSRPVAGTLILLWYTPKPKKV